MIKVLRRRGITLLFLNIIDSCEVKDYIYIYIRLYFHEGKIVHYSITYKIFDITDNLQPSGRNGPKK